MSTKKAFLASAVVVYFIIAFEVIIMISPFAGLFYSAFNPVLLQLAGYPATRWLSAFFLPHMVLPNDGFLVFLRIMGSVLFVLGMAVFLACAIQIYVSKLLKKGAVLGGLYSWIRHPQYLGLSLAGLGLAILWPRFLTAVLWLVMALVYYALARDEERRMLTSFPQPYRAYMAKTGMFLPEGLEKRLTPSSRFGQILFAMVFSALVVSVPFLLRTYTVHHLTLWTGAPNATAVAILPEDAPMMDHRMNDILGLEGIQNRLKADKHYLIYFLPREYVMQGMIADTGGDWKLFDQHRTLGMIMDWVFNPFGHLRGDHHAMHASMPMQPGGSPSMGGGMTRRLIFLAIEDVPVSSPYDLFSINARRIPEFMVDADIHNLSILEIRDLPHGSGWGSVPTPMF